MFGTALRRGHPSHKLAPRTGAICDPPESFGEVGDSTDIARYHRHSGRKGGLASARWRRYHASINHLSETNVRHPCRA